MACWHLDRATAGPQPRRVVSWEGECCRHMSHGFVKRCRIVPPTLNDNVSLGRHSMVLHMELQHALSKVCVCVCARINLRWRAASVQSSCVSSIQLVVTSPNRTGSHALLIQSPQPSRAIEPISLYVAPCRTLAHPWIWILSRFRHLGKM